MNGHWPDSIFPYLLILRNLLYNINVLCVEQISFLIQAKLFLVLFFDVLYVCSFKNNLKQLFTIRIKVLYESSKNCWLLSFDVRLCNFMQTCLCSEYVISVQYSWWFLFVIILINVFINLQSFMLQWKEKLNNNPKSSVQQCFSVRVVMNKDFVNPEKYFGTDASCRFRKKRKGRLIPTHFNFEKMTSLSRKLEG